MKIINILLLIALLISASTCHIKQIVLDEDNNFVVSWDYNTDDQTITFELEGDFKGWFAFGFACQTCDPNSMEAMMGHPDMIAVTYDSNGVPTLVDMIEKMDSNPMQQKDTDIGGQDNIILYGGYQGEHHSAIYYKRKFITGDTIGDYDIDINKDFHVSWYIGSDNNIDFGSPLEAGTNSFSLATGEVVEGGAGGHSHSGADSFGSMYAYHAALEGIAFGFLIPFGIFCARYLRQYSWGFYLHVVIQSVALAFIIVGFIIIIVVHEGKIETSRHGILGVILFSLILATGLGGVISWFWRSDSSDNEKSPIFPHKIHGYVGKVVFLLSIATIITGLNQYFAPIAFIIIYSILILSYFLIATFMELYLRFASTPGGDVSLQKFN